MIRIAEAGNISEHVGSKENNKMQITIRVIMWAWSYGGAKPGKTMSEGT